jgi:hypothetical protein
MDRRAIKVRPRVREVLNIADCLPMYFVVTIEVRGNITATCVRRPAVHLASPHNYSSLGGVLLDVREVQLSHRTAPSHDSKLKLKLSRKISTFPTSSTRTSFMQGSRMEMLHVPVHRKEGK